LRARYRCAQRVPAQRSSHTPSGRCCWLLVARSLTEPKHRDAARCINRSSRRRMDQHAPSILSPLLVYPHRSFCVAMNMPYTTAGSMASEPGGSGAGLHSSVQGANPGYQPWGRGLFPHAYSPTRGHAAQQQQDFTPVYATNASSANLGQHMVNSRLQATTPDCPERSLEQVVTRLEYIANVARELAAEVTSLQGYIQTGSFRAQSQPNQRCAGEPRN